MEHLEEMFDDFVVEREFLALPPLHQAVGWRVWCGWPDTAYFAGTSGVHMQWHEIGEGWTLTVRSYPKESGEDACMIFGPPRPVRPLPAGAKDPMLVGYIRYEYDVRPTLVWNAGADRFVFEDQSQLPLPPGLHP